MISVKARKIRFIRKLETKTADMGGWFDESPNGPFSLAANIQNSDWRRQILSLGGSGLDLLCHIHSGHDLSECRETLPVGVPFAAAAKKLSFVDNPLLERGVYLGRWHRTLPPN